MLNGRYRKLSVAGAFLMTVLAFPALTNQSASLTHFWLALLEYSSSWFSLVYWGLGATFTVLLAVLTAPSIFAPASDVPPRIPDWVYCGVLFLCIIAWRWPYHTMLMENPDEEWILWNAIKLWHRPMEIPVDPGTHGPLTFLSLMPVKLSGYHIDYGALKTIGTLCFAIAAVSGYMFLRTIYHVHYVRLAMLPVPFMFSWGLLYGPDLRACNGEHFVALFGAIAYGTVALWLPRLRDRNFGAWTRTSLFLSGTMVGAIPFAKLQGAIWGAVVGVTFIGIILCEARSKRQRTLALVPLILGGLFPAVFFGVWFYSAGMLGFYVNRVLVSSSDYGVQSGLLEKLPHFYALAVSSDLPFNARVLLAPFLFAGAVLALGYGASRAFRRARRAPALEVVVLSMLLVSIAVMAFSIGYSGKSFAHYMVNMYVPISLFLGASVAHSLTRFDAKWFRMTIGSATVVGVYLLYAPIAEAIRPDRLYITQKMAITGFYKDDVAAVLNLIGDPTRDALHSWGGLDMNILTQIPDMSVEASITGPLGLGGGIFFDQEYFKPHYDTLLVQNPPAFVVDLVKQDRTWFFTDPATHGIHTYPLMFDLLQDKYLLALRSYDGDLYVRSDVAEERLLRVDPVWSMNGGWCEGATPRYHASETLGLFDTVLTYSPGRTADRSTGNVVESEVIDIPHRPGHSTHLVMYLACGSRTGDVLKLILHRSDDGSLPVKELHVEFPVAAGRWKQVTLDLTDYTQQASQLRLRVQANGKDEDEWLAVRDVFFAFSPAE